MADVFPVAYDTTVGQVRALIPDVEQLPNMQNPAAAAEYLFTDAHLQAFIDIENGNVKRAAALACEALGTSEAIISKVIKTEDLQTDGAKTMGQFINRARMLRLDAQREDEIGEDVFEVIPYVLYPPQLEPR